MSNERTLESLLDHRDLCDLLYRYAHALDERRLAAPGDLLHARRGGAVRRGSRSQGRLRRIEKTCQAALNPLDSSQHIIANPEISIDGDRATARCYCTHSTPRRVCRAAKTT